MRVALLSHNAPSGDAVGQQVAAKAAFFRERGADLRVFLECDRQLEPALRSLLRLVTADVPFEWLAGELRDFDLLCIEYSQHYRLLDVLPTLTGKRPRILLDYHGVTPPELWDGPREVMRESQQRRGLIWLADEVIVHSQFMRRELRKATNYPDRRIVQTPLAMPQLAHAPPSLSFRSLPGSADAKRILFVGRLAANKRVPVLIEAIARLKSEKPEFHAVIAGDTGDIYQGEYHRCLELANQLRIRDRVHFLGRVSADELADAYRSADLFVMPSRHEGFCLPVAEAMAHGLPVIAACAGALPETLGDAGLTFTPDDPDDLAAQIRRISQDEPRSQLPKQRRKIAVVAARYGADVLGGAERSSRLIAEGLAGTGHHVEVFTTGPREVVEEMNGVRIHRFPADPVDESKLAASVQRLQMLCLGEPPAVRPRVTAAPSETRGLTAGGSPESAVRDFLEQTRASSCLLANLEIRAADFDAIIAGPYANGLGFEVARQHPEKALLMPCFHNEPLAYQPLMRDTYSRTAGLLYHSAEERQLAQSELGIHHPNSEIVGTWLDRPEKTADPSEMRACAKRPYVVYCGRYCREKNLPLLLDWLQRNEREHPGRFQVACMGEGQVKIPAGMSDLGFLSETEKSDVIAGAAALLQPSVNESLSLVTLEAWRAGVPVIANAGCAAVMGHIDRCGGGRGAGSYEEFRAALSDLHDRPNVWQAMGERGREYVQREYGSQSAVIKRVESAVAAMEVPLAEQMRRRGFARSAEFTPQRWAERFAERVESVLHREVPESRIEIEVEPRSGQPGFTLRTGQTRLVVQIRNTGTRPLLPDGPAATAIQAVLRDGDAVPVGRASTTRLPGILAPGQLIRLPLHVFGPELPAKLMIEFSLIGGLLSGARVMRLPLTVTNADVSADTSLDLQSLQSALSELAARIELPAGYTDVSEGAFAAWKRKLKHKLLNQFQTAYVDVLSRQQTAFNRIVVTVLQELTESTAMLERLATNGERDPAAAPADLEDASRQLSRRVRDAVARIDELEHRLERLEARLEESASK